MRLVWVAWIRPEPISDFARYRGYAEALALDPFAPVARGVSLGYPLFVSFLFRLGLGVHGVYFAQAFLGAFTVYLVADLLKPRRETGIEASQRPFAAWLGGLLLAFAPGHIGYTSILGTEIFAALFLVWGVHAFFAGICGATHGLWRSGIFFGIAASARSAFLYLPYFFLPLLFVGAGRTRFVRVAVFLGAYLAAQGLYSAYSYRVSNYFGVKADHSAIAIWQGTVFEIEGFYSDGLQLPEPYREQVRQETDVAKRNAIYMQLAKQNILSDPLRYFLLGFKKIKHVYTAPGSVLWWNFTQEGTGVQVSERVFRFVEFYLVKYQRILQLGFGLSLVLWGVSWVRRRRQGGLWNGIEFRLWVLALTPIVYLAMIVYVTIIDNRFQIPIIPFICLFAAMAWHDQTRHLWRRVR